MKPMIVLCLFLAALSFESRSQQHDLKNCIEWVEGERLEWSDFKGEPKRATRNMALTDSGMSIELKCDGTTNKAIVKCFFNTEKSWTKDTESDYLLAHEQLHFDITELFVRKLRKQLAKFGDDCQKLNTHIEEYYNRNYREFVTYQDQYDRETEHSLNRSQQAYWQQKVARELEALKPYASLASN